MQKIIVYNNHEIVEKIDSISNASNLPISHWKELLEISKKRNDQVFFIAFINNDVCYCGAIFSKNKRRIAGINYSCLFLYGYDFFDFNFIYIDSDYYTAYLSYLKKFAQSQSINFINLENLYQNKRIESSFKLQEEICLLDSSIDDFSYIYRKKSLIRKRKKIVKQFDYQVKHFKGEEITDDLICQLVNLHKERWAFDGIKSSFYQENRLAFYTSCKSNKLLTILYLDNNVMAMHYGMILDKKLIFHTPVVNIKYYQYSPMSMLLLEIAIHCEENDLNELNLGLGSETYKNRFSNSFQTSYTYYFPLGAFNKLRFFFLFQLSKNKSKFESLLALLKKIYRSSISLKNKVCFYKSMSLQVNDINVSSSLQFNVCSSFSELVVVFKESNETVKRYHYNRIMNNDKFYFFLEDKEIVCSGWLTQKPLFVSEKNKTLDVKDGVILYDFYTQSKFRNKGYYQKLLACILNDIEPNSKAYIYALKSNVASNKAILKAGFELIDSSKIF